MACIVALGWQWGVAIQCGRVAEFYDDGIQKPVKRYDKCLSLAGDYVG